MVGVTAAGSKPCQTLLQLPCGSKKRDPPNWHRGPGSFSAWSTRKLPGTRTIPPSQTVSQNGRYNRRHHLLVHLLFLWQRPSWWSHRWPPVWVYLWAHHKHYLWQHPWLHPWPHLPEFTSGHTPGLTSGHACLGLPLAWLHLWPHLPGFTSGHAPGLTSGHTCLGLPLAWLHLWPLAPPWPLAP